MATEPSSQELSFLDQIRQAEAEVTRRIAVANEAAHQRVANARSQVTQMINLAREAGQSEGQARYQQIINQAEAEAQDIIAKAEEQAKELRRQGITEMSQVVELAVNFITEQAEEG